MLREYEIVGIIRRVIEDMAITIKVCDSVDNGDGTFTINTCNTQYINECMSFDLNGNVYNVVDFENDEYVTITGGPQITEDFKLRPPTFIPDTPMGANNELLLSEGEPGVHPFIWLLENFESDFDRRGKHVSESRIKLFFLDLAENGSWLEGTHRKNCILPMLNLGDLFIKDLESKVSGKIERYSVINRIRFGKYVNSKGHEKSILDQELSGVELDITIPVQKWSIKCKKC